MKTGVPLLHDFLHETAARLPTKTALVTRGLRYSFQTLETCTNALARALAERGVERGDRVLLFCENGFEAAVAFWATLSANAVAVPVSPEAKAEKLAYILNDCRPRAMIADASLSPVFEEALSRAGSPPVLVVSGELDREHHRALRSVVLWKELELEEASPPPRRCIDVDLAAILYTSSSSGEPKGVMLTHRNMMTAATSITAYLEHLQEDVVLCALPLSFDYGLYPMLVSAKVGACLVLEKSFAQPEELLVRIEEEKVTGVPGVPTMFGMMGNVPTVGDYDLSSVRYVTNTAAALSPQHVHRLREIFPRASVYATYGLTEGKRCTYLPPDDLDRKPTSIGIPIPNTEAWILDDEGHRVEANVVGQLVIRGATVMSGYWQKPAATAERLKPGPLPGEVVLYTGDLCRMDEEGYLYFVGRMDDVLKRRGAKVAPKQIEHVLLAVPGVREVAVIGVDDELDGQVPKAFVVLEDGSDLDVTALEQACNERLESLLVPKTIEIAASLPRMRNGRIDKRALV